MAQIIAEADAERRKPDPEGHLAAPQRPDRKAAAKDDARRNEEAMERNHRGGRPTATHLSPAAAKPPTKNPRKGKKGRRLPRKQTPKQRRDRHIESAAGGRPAPDNRQRTRHRADERIERGPPLERGIQQHVARKRQRG